ncbi:hypothetical protein CVT26_010043 [Gymnopilus dilepis]|uniref:Uncharacterized protein n=1 Tax=Gymnopilus dilepis TaxID=231916 RepID=A0A409WTF7_9AGAR|nr:hypothetical protein CVT26_010043 [Gymnopilus dilepis]
MSKRLHEQYRLHGNSDSPRLHGTSRSSTSSPLQDATSPTPCRPISSTRERPPHAQSQVAQPPVKDFPAIDAASSVDLNISKSRGHGQQSEQRLSGVKARTSGVAAKADKENAGVGSKRKAATLEKESNSKRSKKDRTRPSIQGLASDALARSSSPVSSQASAFSSLYDPTQYFKECLFDQLPADCDSGFRNTLVMLTSVAWHRGWDMLISEWLHFEGIYQFKGTCKFKPTHRPSVVSDWIKRARSSTYRPQIDARKFQKEFWTWWAFIQPQWRSIKDGDAPQVVKGNWDAVDVPGVNGWPSVLVALFFWGNALGANWKTTASWMNAVEDVYWVLVRVRSSHPVYV